MVHDEDRYERFYMDTVDHTSTQIICMECGDTVHWTGGAVMRDVVASMDHHLDTCPAKSGEGAS
jgi:hypothetical protein